MSLNRIAYTPADLADAMLDAYKAWARIDHDDDDVALTLLLCRVFDLLERQWGITIAPAEWLWIPNDPNAAATHPQPDNRLHCCNSTPPVSWAYYPVPFRGFVEFTVTRAAVDVSGEFYLAGDTFPGDFGQQYLAAVPGTSGLQSGDVVNLAVGFEPETSIANGLPPALLDVIFRYGLYIWENRESATDKALTEVPDFLTRVWFPFWAPRV